MDSKSDAQHEIKTVQFVALRTPLDPPAKFSWGAASERNVGLVRVELADGTTGWGETSVTFPLWSMEERAVTVANLGPMVEGATFEDLGGIAEIIEQLRANTARLQYLWSPVGISGAIGAIEMALIDALARCLDLPAWKLFDGEPREQELYAVGFTGGPSDIASQAQQALDGGFSAIKLRVGFGLEADVEQVGTVRDVVGPQARILLDANMGWNRESAREAIAELSQFNPAWIEEPLVCTDVEGLREIRSAIDIPVAAGENAYNPDQLNQLLQAEAVDVLMPDLARCGGFLTARTAALSALEAGIEVSPHHYASDIGFAADLALMATLPKPGMLLRDVSKWPIREEIAGGSIRIEGGSTRAFTGSGLAPEPDKGVISRSKLT